MQLIVVPLHPGPLLRIELDGAGQELERRHGVPIDASDPDVGSLVDAYESVLAREPRDETTVTAAHFALLETASLLRWAPPAGPAEREYVRRHTRTIAGLARRQSDDALAYLRAEAGGPH